MKSRAILVCLAIGLFTVVVATGGDRTESNSGETPVAASEIEDRELAEALRVALESELAAQQSATADAAPAPTGPNPVVVVETSKGSFEIELYPQDAPRSVAIK